MKNNNRGFIAISLIYSFFLVFLITLLTILSDYAKNRILLNDVKKETQEYLNGLAEFNPVTLENKEYEVGEELIFGSDRWNVIEDDGENVTLILARTLSEEEINSALTDIGILNASQEDKSLMCLNYYHGLFCNFESNIAYNYYTWNSSVVKRIIEEWFNKNAPLQKSISLGIMQLMDFSDNIMDYSAYFRIPLATEFDILNDTEIWYLTSDSRNNGLSSINLGNTTALSHTTYKKIKPVIKIKKSI